MITKQKEKKDKRQWRTRLYDGVKIAIGRRESSTHATTQRHTKSVNRQRIKKKKLP